MDELSGKSALVTGGARRIGRAIALTLAHTGADVAITYLTGEREARRTVADLRTLGVRALAVRCDVRDERSVRHAVTKVVRELGALDILVNNAAVYETADLEEIRVADWDRVFATNTRGPFLVTRAALAHLRRRRGRVINLASLGGLRPWTTHAHYCASKAALIMLTRIMAKAFAPQVSVNCVAPGMIDTGERRDVAFLRKLANRTPMRANGTPDDVAAAVRFFAAGPHYITGQVLVVDGGLELA